MFVPHVDQVSVYVLLSLHCHPLANRTKLAAAHMLPELP